MSRDRIVPGVLLTALGVVFLLGNLDVLDAGAFIAGWWPVVFLAIGAARLLGRPPDALGGAITAAIGLVLLSITQHAVEWSVLAYLWPVALIGLGVSVLSGRRPRAADTADAVAAIAVLSGRKLTSTSRRFAGGSLLAIFGGVELDLRAATPAPGARLDVTAIFGGCEVSVPPGWRVRMSGPAILGGYEDHTVGALLPEDGPVLDVRVLAFCGGVEVKPAATLPPMPIPEERSTT